MDGCNSETFADMFLGWTYYKWGSSDMGDTRRSFMDGIMPGWIEVLTMDESQ